MSQCNRTKENPAPPQTWKKTNELWSRSLEIERKFRIKQQSFYKTVLEQGWNTLPLDMVSFDAAKTMPNSYINSW